MVFNCDGVQPTVVYKWPESSTFYFAKKNLVVAGDVEGQMNPDAKASSM